MRLVREKEKSAFECNHVISASDFSRAFGAAKTNKAICFIANYALY